MLLLVGYQTQLPAQVTRSADFLHLESKETYSTIMHDSKHRVLSPCYIDSNLDVNCP